MFALHQSVDLQTSGPPKMLIVAINKKYTLNTSRSFYKTLERRFYLHDQNGRICVVKKKLQKPDGF